jgi:hypothetical protein
MLKISRVAQFLLQDLISVLQRISSFANKKTYSAIAKAGFTKLSLAVFLKRPQADIKSALLREESILG